MSTQTEAERVRARRAQMALAARQSSPYALRATAAAQLGLSENTLGRYERGERDIPMDVIERMERTYRLVAGYLAHPSGVPRGTVVAPDGLPAQTFVESVLFTAGRIAELANQIQAAAVQQQRVSYELGARAESEMHRAPSEAIVPAASPKTRHRRSS